MGDYEGLGGGGAKADVVVWAVEGDAEVRRGWVAEEGVVECCG